jgi:hypothetical protein
LALARQDYISRDVNNVVSHEKVLSPDEPVFGPVVKIITPGPDIVPAFHFRLPRNGVGGAVLIELYE